MFQRLATSWGDQMTALLANAVLAFLESDEGGTLAALKAHRRELIDPIIDKHRGRIVKLMGDGALVEYASVVDAVAASVEVQRAIIERNAERPDDAPICFRMEIGRAHV
mgnify:CR=1 FL=1